MFPHCEVGKPLFGRLGRSQGGNRQETAHKLFVEHDGARCKDNSDAAELAADSPPQALERLLERAEAELQLVN